MTIAHVPDTFVDDDANGMSSDVEDTTRLAVIESVRHTLLYRTIALRKEDALQEVGGASGRYHEL